LYITTRGLVLREAKYKESSKMLTVLTETEGKISVAARGVMRRGSKTAPSAQLLAFSEMTLSSGKEVWTLTEARPVELFLGLRDELSSMALGSYFAELLDLFSDADIPDPLVLSLGLNALYALSREMKPAAQIKAAFELRLLSEVGYAPMTGVCPVCGEDITEPVFWPAAGAVTCRTCDPAAGGARLELCKSSHDAMQYILQADPKRLFSFRISEDALKRLAHVVEEYVRVQLEREPSTLAFYRKVAQM